MNKKDVRVTLLDDEQLFLASLEQMVESIDLPAVNLKVETFQDGQEFLAAESYKNQEPHILVTNDILSKRSGVAVTQFLRKLEDSSRFIVILLSRGTTDDEIVHAYQTGIDYYLARPVNLQILRAVIERVLERLSDTDGSFI